MTKLFVSALALAGAFWLITPALADAAPRPDGVREAAQTTDLSAHRRRYRHSHRRAVRVYRYPAPVPYGYYGPTYYERPYRSPAPLFFGFGGRW